MKPDPHNEAAKMDKQSLIGMNKTVAKYLLAFCLMCNVGNVIAQHRYYCEVKGIEKELTSGLKIILDLGTNAPYNIWGDLNRKLILVDENGDEIKFKSMVDAANYMGDKGWIFQQTYSSTYGEKPVIHWIFYKEAENIDKAREGIMTRAEYQNLKK